jgi:hypothetical protein
MSSSTSGDHLHIEGHQDPFQYLNSTLSLRVFSATQSGSRKPLSPAISVQVFAHPLLDHAPLFQPNRNMSKQSELTLAEDACSVITKPAHNGLVQVEVFFKQLSLHRANSEFYLLISAPGATPVWSSPFYVVKNKLMITAQPPERWYKDKGGLKKQIRVGIRLTDDHGQSVLKREVPLRVDLV